MPPQEPAPSSSPSPVSSSPTTSPTYSTSGRQQPRLISSAIALLLLALRLAPRVVGAEGLLSLSLDEDHRRGAGGVSGGRSSSGGGGGGSSSRGLRTETVRSSSELQNAYYRASSEGDTIVAVAGATYEGPGGAFCSGGGALLCCEESKEVTFLCSDVEVQCTLDGQGSRPVLYLSGQTGKSSSFTGFAFTNGLSYRGGGFSLMGSTVSLVKCSVSSNTASTVGGGIFSSYATLSLIKCNISSNTASAGGGIYAHSGKVDIYAVVFWSNLASDGAGGDDVDCGSSYYNDEYFTVRSTCPDAPPGYSTTATKGSALAAAGSATGSLYSYSCTVCPAGSYRVAKAISDCSFCPFGKYLSDAATSASLHDSSSDCTGTCTVSCAAGNACFSSNSCEPCPVGSYSSIGNGCVVCPAGTYADLEATSACAVCPSGRYNPDPATSPALHDALDDCASCPVGTHLSDEGTLAEAHSSPSRCLTCAAGKYAESEGSRSCTSCPVGTYLSDNAISAAAHSSSSQCLTCAAGKYAASEGSSICTSCPVGTYLSDGGTLAAAHSSSSQCLTCAAGKYSDMKGASACTICPSGKYNSDAATSASLHDSVADCNGTCTVSCAAGLACFSSNTCDLCPVGSYSSSGNGCIVCPAGKYAELEGTSACSSCPAGTYLSYGGTFVEAHSSSSQCMTCPLGTYSDLEGASACIVCPAGRFNACCGGATYSPEYFDALDDCTLCPVGTYLSDNALSADAHLWGSCLPCEAGSYGDSEGASECTVCAAGSYNTGYHCESTFTPCVYSCEPCVYGKYLSDQATSAAAHSSVDLCLPCRAGTYSFSAEGAGACTACPVGKMSFPGSESCKAALRCASDEYLSGMTCATCNNTFSAVFIALCFASFVAASFYIQNNATDRQKMIQVKVVSTFFQVAQLTTAIKIGWPRIAFMTLPFSLPFTDAKCLSSGSGWNQLHTFYCFFYLPLLVPVVLLICRRRLKAAKANSTQMVVFLILIWYSPVIQSAASMFHCYMDDFEGSVLVSDPTVSCSYGTVRNITWAHVAALYGLLGIGFPIYVVVVTLRLRRDNKLNAGSPYSALFEWYTPNAPYFEAVILARKALLILVTTVPESPTAQALSSLGVNAAFLLLLCKLSPFVYCPSSIFKSWNFNMLVEVLSACTTILGNVLAAFGSYMPALVNEVGIVFAAVNLCFALLFFGGYALDAKRMQKAIVAPIEGITSNNPAFKKSIGKDVIKLVQEWGAFTAVIGKEPMGSKKRLRMIKETPFLRSKVAVAIRKQMQTLERGDPDKETAEEALQLFDQLLTRMKVESGKYAEEGGAGSHRDFCGAFSDSVEQIATSEGMKKLLSVLPVKKSETRAAGPAETRITKAEDLLL